MTGTPRVTVYLPTRNRARSLAEAAASVLQQDFRDLELIIVDDASTDLTPEVAARLQRQDSRVQYVRLPARCGAPAARNAAIERASGQFATGIDDDDLMLPGRIDSLLARHQDKYSLICSGFLHERGTWRRPVLGRPREISLDQLLHYNLVGNQALVLTDRLREVGGFDVAMEASQDYDLWTRLVQRYGPALRIGPPSYVFREDEERDSISRSPRAAEGARQYARKHGPLMRPAHQRSQRLLQAIAARERLGARDLARCFSLSTAPLLLRYLVRTRLPFMHELESCYRDRRWRNGSGS